MTLLKLLWSFFWEPEEWLIVLEVAKRMRQEELLPKPPQPKRNRTMWG